MIRARSLAAILAVSVLGTLAATASAAQAAEFTIEGKTLLERSIEKEAIAGSGGPLAISLVHSGILIEIDCASSLVGGGEIKPKGLTQLTVSFFECELFVNEIDLSGLCQITSMAIPPVTGQLVAQEGGIYNVFTAATILKFTVTKVSEEIAFCPLEGENGMSGSIAGLTEEGERTEQPLSLSPVNLFYGEAPVELLESELTLALAGKNPGKPWAAIE